MKRLLATALIAALTFAVLSIARDGGRGLATFRFNLCDSEGDGWKQTNPGMNPLFARFNCIQIDRYVIELGDAPAAGTSFDWDSLWTTDAPGRFVKFGGTRYNSLEAFQATGQEPNGFQRRCQ